MQLVEPLARRYAALSGQDLDDLQQVGLLGLLRAAERFEGQRRSFLSLRSTPYQGAIQTICATKLQSSDSALRRTVIGTGGFNAATQRRRLALEDDLISHQTDQSHDLIERRIGNSLPGVKDFRQEHTALVEVILKGQSLSDVARRTGVSAMTFSVASSADLPSCANSCRFSWSWPDPVRFCLGRDGRCHSSDLTLESVTPETKRAQFALLVMTLPVTVFAGGTTKGREEHPVNILLPTFWRQRSVHRVHSGHLAVFPLAIKFGT